MLNYKNNNSNIIHKTQKMPNRPKVHKNAHNSPSFLFLKTIILKKVKIEPRIISEIILTKALFHPTK